MCAVSAFIVFWNICILNLLVSGVLLACYTFNCTICNHLKHNLVTKLALILFWLDLFIFLPLLCLLRVVKYLNGNVNKKTIKPSVKAKMLVKK